jgi:two-component system, chemotaxis family, CheB/CheR fusion protein
MSEIEGKETTTGDLVVVGSSAGGIEALSILVNTLPEDFPAPIVLAQHLDPSRPSSLEHILQRRTKLKVEIVLSSTSLQPGKIYVVPANRHVSIKDHHVQVQEDQMKRPKPSVDTLLSTAAEAYGDHLIAVVLTGSGSDGAAGAVDVKNAGGTVIIQDPQTARYPSMPLALPPTVVDFEADIEQIGSLLYDLLTGARVQQTEERAEDVLHEILEHVGRQASIDFRPYKTSTILRRIGRRMTVTHCRTMQDYMDYLKVHPGEVGELVKAFLINVTQFFRDAEAFAFLKKKILPELVAHARDHGRILRFWAAGCATGEEPYSLAMLLTDMLGAELSQWSIKIFATDLDEGAINFARRGIYSENLLGSMPPEYQDRFFERISQGYRISKTLRQMIIFGQQDLSRSAPFPRIDLVMCRNVLIYFTPQLQDYVLNQFAFSLYPNGYLFLGKAETVRPIQSFYELVNKQWKVYRCVGNAFPAVRRQSFPSLSEPRLEEAQMRRQRPLVGKTPVDQDPPSSSVELAQLRRFNELLLRFLPTGVIVIDRSYHILTANGAARRLLGLHDVISEQDFLHSVRGIPYHEIRAAIDTVFREHNGLSLPDVELAISSGGNGRFVSLSISLMQLEAGTPDLAVITITDITQQVQTRRQLESAQAEQAQLINELRTTNKRLGDVNKEVMDANEELQVANEELMLTHEELQASIEEFETTNEELQATNEELETNNEELQATNEELETTNEELRARTSELQELTSVLEGERARLAEMVELSPFYILVLSGPSLIVEAYNPHYARLVETKSVQGHPLDEVIDLFWETGLEIVHLARDAYRLDKVHTTSRTLTHLPRIQGSQEEPVMAYLTYTIVPSHDRNGKVNGVIIYAVDETEKRLRESEDEREKFKLIFSHAPSAALALYDAQTTELLIASPYYLETVGRVHNLPSNELIARKWSELAITGSTSEEVEGLWKRAVENREPQSISELSHRPTPEDEETIWDYSLTPIMDPEPPQEILYMLVSAVEITGQVQTRKELERLDNLKDEFLSLATHELRSPLSTIMSNAQLLQRNLQRRVAELANDDASRQQLDRGASMLNSIIHQVRRMNKMIGEMLDVARMRGDVFKLYNDEHVNLVELVRQVVEQYRARSNKLDLHTPRKELYATVDADRIEQVLNNLIENAIKYSPPDRAIEVRVERRSSANSYDAVIVVHDEGPGISKEEQEHIFERFYRIGESPNKGRSGGLGLGLYIVHEIVSQQGGHVWVESQPGKGSTFFFTLPLENED